MQYSDIKTSLHDWEKKNLVTINNRGKMYDEVVCRNCGMRGKRFGFTDVQVSGRCNPKNVHRCPKGIKKDIPTVVKVTKCEGFGEVFNNLLPNTEHEVISAPMGYSNDSFGVWVMGVGEPVKLLSNEFEKVK